MKGRITLQIDVPDDATANEVAARLCEESATLFHHHHAVDNGDWSISKTADRWSHYISFRECRDGEPDVRI